MTVLYILIASMATGVSISDLSSGSVATTIISSVAMIMINKNYYDKRKELFVN